MTAQVASGLVGKLRIWTLILGFIVIFLASRSAYYSTLRDHEWFYGSNILVFIISLIFFVGTFVGIIDGHLIFRRFDVGFHFFGAILLLATGVVFVINVVHYTSRVYTTQDFFGEQLAAGVIGVVNGLIYGYIASLLNRNLRGSPSLLPTANEL